MVKSAERRGFLPSLKDFYSMISEQPVTNPGLPDGGLMFSFRRMWTTVREFEDIRYREKGTHLFLCPDTEGQQGSVPTLGRNVPGYLCRR